MGNINFNFQSFGNSRDRKNYQIPLSLVDRIADSLVEEFSNPMFRSWYCGVIYEFGIPKVEEWRNRAGEGKEPAKLFSKYVKEARTFRGFRRSLDA